MPIPNSMLYYFREDTLQTLCRKCAALFTNHFMRPEILYSITGM